MRFLAFLFAVLLASPLFGMDIPADCQVANEKPGYCCWVSLEILGKVHGIKQLDSLVESRKKDPDRVFLNSVGNREIHPKNLGYGYAVKEKLNKLGVRYWLQEAGRYDRTLLRCASTHGCIVAVRQGAIPGYKQCHAIIVTQYNKDGVIFFDCNHPGKRWSASKEWFDFYWTGLAIVVEKSK